MVDPFMPSHAMPSPVRPQGLVVHAGQHDRGADAGRHSGKFLGDQLRWTTRISADSSAAMPSYAGFRRQGEWVMLQREPCLEPRSLPQAAGGIAFRCAHAIGRMGTSPCVRHTAIDARQ
jgi:hypothetical protein